MNYPYAQIVLDGSTIPEQTQTSVFVERTGVNRPISPCMADLPAGSLQSESSPICFGREHGRNKGEFKSLRERFLRFLVV
jgi:hypothetical protein